MLTHVHLAIDLICSWNAVDDRPVQFPSPFPFYFPISTSFLLSSFTDLSSFHTDPLHPHSLIAFYFCTIASVQAHLILIPPSTTTTQQVSTQKMRFLTTLVAVAASLTTALAQVNIAFTSIPTPIVVGQQANITWGGGDGVTVRQLKNLK